MRSILLLLAFIALSSSLRVYRDSSNDVAGTSFNPNAPGRLMPMKIVDGVRRSPCQTPEALSSADQLICKNMLLRQNRHERIQRKLSKKLNQSAPTPSPQQTGFLVNAQWDGMTEPNVQWALDVTRQSALEFPGVPDEVQLQLLIPPRSGPANAPTFTSYDPLSRQYMLVTKQNDKEGMMFGVTVAGDVNSTTLNYPKQRFAFPHAKALMVGLESVTLPGGATIMLVFFADGFVLKVDPSTGASSPYTQLCNATRVVTAVTYRPDTHDIFLLSTAPPGIGRRPDWAIITFNFATKQSNEIVMQVPQYFNPLDSSGFEMLWMNSVQNLAVFYTGFFDQIIYYNPYTGSATFMYGNLAEFDGAYGGQLEFTVDSFLVDLDTDANAAIDNGVGQTFYFQCSDVDKSTGLVTIELCSHEMPTDLTALTWININIAPMTYGYAGSEFVQIDSL